MTLSIILLFFTQLILPLIFLSSLFAYDSVSLPFLLKLAQTCFFMSFIFFAGRWDWVSYYVRWLLPLFFAGCVASIMLRPGFFVYGGAAGYGTADYVINIAVALVFLVFMLRAIRGQSTSEPAIECDFPLKDGVFYIAHGGADKLINHHQTVTVQKYGLDILKLDWTGLRCRGIYPKTLEKYHIFGTPVYAPVAGVVTQAVDGMDDLIPPARDREHLGGNYVVIDAGNDISIALVHLAKGSVAVSEGTAIERGRYLGRIGNSGNTTEPHLHIHAVRGSEGDYLHKGVGVPMRFRGKFVVRNTLVRGEKTGCRL